MRKFVSPGVFLKKKKPQTSREAIMEKRKTDEVKRIEGILTGEGAENLTTTEYARLKSKLKRLRGGKDPAFAESFGLSARLNPKYMPETAKKAQQEEEKRQWIQQWQGKPQKTGAEKLKAKERSLKPFVRPRYGKL